MNRFDRVTSLLLLLQTRSVVTAKFLANRFDVSERTIYRDIRTLETAGVPIGAEAGIGYFLERGYRLPPIAFTRDEAAALLLGERLLASSLDDGSLRDFGAALDKVRAVSAGADQDHLDALDADLEVLPTGSHFPIDAAHVPVRVDRFLRECREAVVCRQVIEIEYESLADPRRTLRLVEPIGLFHYSWHWHLIGWCRLRAGYRDFRLDRIAAVAPLAERFARRERLTLRQYLDGRLEREDLMEVELRFGVEAARFVGEQRHLFGFVDEELEAEGVRMRFLTSVPDYLARWLLQYVDEVEVIKGDLIREALKRSSARLHAHWAARVEVS